MTPGNQLRVELHCHTVYSHDGHIEFDGLVRTARHRLDVICITDHDTIEGARDFQKRSKSRNTDFEVVIGEERTLADHSHVIGLFLQAPISSDTFDDVVHEIREQNGLCVIPHPFRHRDGAFRQTIRSLDGISGFEIFNPKCSLEENLKSHALCRSGPVAVGGSDAHYESDLGECVNYVPATGDVRRSLENFLHGCSGYKVLGIQQKSGQKGRQYAPLYYRVKPYVRIPRPLVPAVGKLYRAYRNSISRYKTPVLETKYVSE
ncbi:MAG TPA: PHP domain-containing protein [Verrucomicrobiae bacterium]|nr:PHP domain-containing protein [Verrucomicrobiae bacterium]